MRNETSRLFFMVALLLVAMPGLAARLMAPLYPGAVIDPVASAQSKTAAIYLSRSSLAIVRAWYVKHLAKRSAAACSERDEGCGKFKHQCETVTRKDRMTRCQDLMVLKWNAIPPGGSMVDAYNAGVQLEGWQKVAGTQNLTSDDSGEPAMTDQASKMMVQLNAMSQKLHAANEQETKQIQKEGKQMGVDVVDLSAIPDMPFAGLKQEVLSGRHSQKQLDAVYKKHEWLDRAFCPLHKTSSGSETYEHWLVNKTRARIQEPQRAVGSAAKQFGEGTGVVAAHIQKLIAEGHIDEARQLSQQMATTMQGGQQIGAASGALQRRDHWNEWMDVIHKLEDNAYKTKIIINIKPGKG